jgi:thymidylate synthase (FAD)
MTKEIKVLDHGYCALIESWGSDERIIEAARMSVQKGFVGWQKCSSCGEVDPKGSSCTKHSAGLHHYEPLDEKLLAYLWKNKHVTPFEMAGMTIEVQAPIFVFREWHRHRSQSYNEMSARYAPLPDVNYIPSVERLMMNAGTSNKQAGTTVGSDVLTEDKAITFQEMLDVRYEQMERTYQSALQAGVPKELARLILPVGRYSKMRASANLRNWLGFLILRMDPAAQWEIRQFANAVGVFIEESFPRTWALFRGESS